MIGGKGTLIERVQCSSWNEYGAYLHDACFPLSATVSNVINWQRPSRPQGDKSPSCLTFTTECYCIQKQAARFHQIILLYPSSRSLPRTTGSVQRHVQFDHPSSNLSDTKRHSNLTVIMSMPPLMVLSFSELYPHDMYERIHTRAAGPGWPVIRQTYTRTP